MNDAKLSPKSGGGLVRRRYLDVERRRAEKTEAALLEAQNEIRALKDAIFALRERLDREREGKERALWIAESIAMIARHALEKKP